MIALANPACNVQAYSTDLFSHSTLYKVLIIGILVVSLAGINKSSVEIQLFANALDDFVGISQAHLAGVLLETSS